MKDNEKVHSLYREWFSKEELASKLGVTTRTINNMFNRGQLARRETSEGVQWALLNQFQDEVHETAGSHSLNSANKDFLETEVISHEVSSCISMKREKYEALQEELSSCQLDLARAEGTIRSQEQELLHLRELTRAYVRQKEVSLWRSLMTAFIELFER